MLQLLPDLVQPLGADRVRRAQLLREKAHAQLFQHPAVFLQPRIVLAFALGQQDATLKGHLLTGGVSVGGIGSMVLHANGANGVDGVEFRFMADRNGTVATALMNTDRAAADYHSANFFMAALMNDGSVRAWGRALAGQQGTGSTGDIGRTFPARPG